MTAIPIAFVIGRILFGLYWLQNAYNHLFKSAGLVGYAQSKGVGAAKAAIFGTGILLLVGGISILLGLYPTIGIICLIVFLLGVTFKMHAYWNETDPGTKYSQQIAFYKNMAIMSALLMLLAIPQPWWYSL